MVSKTSTVAGSYTTLKGNKSSQNVAKPNEQHQFDLLYMPDNVFEGNTYKYILTGVEVASRYKDPLGPKNQAKLNLCWKQSITKVACLNIPRYFNVIMGLNLKIKWQSCLKNIMLISKKRQRNTRILIQPLWKPLTNSWKNCCLNRRCLRASRPWKSIDNLG